MSFSSEVKNEICKMPLNGAVACCKAEAYGMLLYANSFAFDRIRMMTENSGICKRIPPLFQKAFSLEIPSIQSTGGKTIFEIQEPSALRKIFTSLGYDYKYYIKYPLNRNIVEEDNCRAAFLRGIFLMGGAVAAPDKKSHLEIATGHRNLAKQVMSLMLDMDFSPKITIRKTTAVIYFKDTSSIEDFLTLVGAPLSSMAMMEAKIEKDLRNSVNRKVNCETANLIKASSVAAQQIAVIRKAIEQKGMRIFPESAYETIHLRLENPSVSLSELAAMFHPPMSKPGVGHRLKKIVETAEKALRKEER